MQYQLLKWNLLFIFFVLSLIRVDAQQTVIKGIVVDQVTNTPIEFVSISLVGIKDTTLVAGVLTKRNGSFNLNLIRSGIYSFRAFSLSYQPLMFELVVDENQKVLQIDTIKLNPKSALLGEVIVTGRKQSAIANKLDKQIFRADQFESAKGGTAIDVLKNLPSIALNSSGEITVRGSTGFLVLLNGKPVLTDAQTVLSQLPANSLENIELITAPSAKYDADGRSGIINITTKTGSTDGIAFQLNILGGLPSTTPYNNLEKPTRFGGDFIFSFRKKTWDLSISANYNRNDANGERVGDVYTLNEMAQTRTRFPSVGERSFDRYNYGIRTALTYNPNKRNSFNMVFFASKKYQQRRADIAYRNSTEDLITGNTIRQFTYFNSNLQNKEGKFILGSFDYAHTFNNSSKLIASAIYEHADLYGNTINQNLDIQTKSSLFQLVNNPYTNPISGYRIKIDYSSTIGKGRLDAGYQFRDDQQNGQFDYFVSPQTNQPDIFKFRGTAKSSNQINAFYIQYAGNQNKLQYTTGLRYELSNRAVFLSADPNPHYLNLRNLFPSFNLLYAFNNAWNLKAGYSKRIQRNNNFELNPIPEREHSETLEQGDPDLLPQLVDLIELGVNHSFKKGSFFSTFYFQQIKNPIQRVNSVYADTILNRLFTNVDRATLMGLELGASLKFNKIYSLYLGANLYNYKINGLLNVLGTQSQVNTSNWVYSMNINNNFNFGKNWNLQAGLNYLSARVSAQGEDSRFFNPSTSLKKTLMNGQMSIGLQWQNMNLGFLNANQQRITTWGKNFYTTTNYIYETDVFLLNINYSINKLNYKSKLPNSEISEKEF